MIFPLIFNTATRYSKFPRMNRSVSGLSILFPRSCANTTLGWLLWLYNNFWYLLRQDLQFHSSEQSSSLFLTLFFYIDFKFNMSSFTKRPFCNWFGITSNAYINMENNLTFTIVGLCIPKHHISFHVSRSSLAIFIHKGFQISCENFSEVPYSLGFYFDSIW